MNDSAWRYRAFLSYTHATPDGDYARRLQRALERQWIPKGVGSSNAPRRRVGRVFRDTTEIGSAPSLTAEITRALRESEFLVLLASPRSATSAWVDQEVREFLAQGRPDRVLVVDLDGNPPESLPPSYREHVARSGEPLRVPASSQTGWRGRVALRETSLRVLHRLAGCNLDDLAQRVATEDARQRRLVLATGLVTILALALLSGVALFQRSSAVLARGKEQVARREAEGSARRLAYSATSQAIAQRDVAGAVRFLENLSAEEDGWLVRALSHTIHQASRTLQAHEERITCLAVSPDSRQLATLDQSGLVRVWDRATLSMLGELRGADPETRGLAFTKQGALLVGGPGGTILQRDPAGVVTTVDFVPELRARLAALPATATTIIALFPESGPLGLVAVHRLGIVSSFAPEEHVLSLQASPTMPCVIQCATSSVTRGKVQLACGLSNGSTTRFTLPLRPGESPPLEDGDHRLMVTSIWADQDSSLWATADVSGQLVLRQGASITGRVQAHTGTVYSITEGPDGYLWTTGRDGTVAAWDTSGRPRIRLLEHRGIVESLVVCKAEREGSGHAYSVDQQGWLAEWNLDRVYPPGQDLSLVLEALRTPPVPGTLSPVVSAAGGRLLLLGVVSPSTQVFEGTWIDLAERRSTGSVRIKQGFPLATVGADRLLSQVLERADGIDLVLRSADGSDSFGTWPLGSEGVSHLGLVKDGVVCGLSGGDALVVPWDGEARRIAIAYSGEPPLKGLQVALDPQGHRGAGCHITATARDSRIHLLDLDQGSILRTVDVGGTVSALTWDPHASCALVGVAEMGARGGRDLLRVFPDGRTANLTLGDLPPTMVLAMAVHPEEPLLAVGLGDGLVVLWSLETGHRLVDLGRLDGAPYKVEFVEDGRFLIAESPTGDSRYWDGGSLVESP